MLTMLPNFVCRDFEIPPGFESVKGSGAMTREAVINTDQELWFFKLPKSVRSGFFANLHTDT